MKNPPTEPASLNPPPDSTMQIFGDCQKKKLQIGIIGLGKEGFDFFYPLLCNRSLEKKDIHIHAVSDLSFERRERMRETNPEISIYTHSDILLEREKENLDLIFLAVPHLFQPEIILSCLHANIPVLTGPPFANFPSEVEAIKKLVIKNNNLFPLLKIAQSGLSETIKKSCAHPLVGEMRYAMIRQTLVSPPVGHDEWQPNWRLHPELSRGGVGRELGCDLIAMVLDWVGIENIESVSSLQASWKGDRQKAFQKTSQQSFPLPTVEDCMGITLRQKSSFIQIQMAWGVGKDSLRGELFFDKGYLYFDEKSYALYIKNEKKEEGVFDPPTLSSSTINHFIDILIENKKSSKILNLSIHALYASLLVNLAYASSQLRGAELEVHASSLTNTSDKNIISPLPSSTETNIDIGI